MKDQRGLCEDALLKVKGVISFTFQMASKRCTVRIRSDLPTEVTHKHPYCQSVLTFILLDWTSFSCTFMGAAKSGCDNYKTFKYFEELVP